MPVYVSLQSFTNVQQISLLRSERTSPHLLSVYASETWRCVHTVLENDTFFYLCFSLCCFCTSVQHRQSRAFPLQCVRVCLPLLCCTCDRADMLRVVLVVTQSVQSVKENEQVGHLDLICKWLLCTSMYVYRLSSFSLSTWASSCWRSNRSSVLLDNTSILQRMWHKINLMLY